MVFTISVDILSIPYMSIDSLKEENKTQFSNLYIIAHFWMETLQADVIAWILRLIKTYTSYFEKDNVKKNKKAKDRVEENIFKTYA